MIKILNPQLIRQAVLNNVVEASRVMEINGEYTLDFTSVVDEKITNYVDDDIVLEYDNDYFDLAYYDADEFLIKMECEHVSYRLNDPIFDLEHFTTTGTASQCLSQILEGTGFTVGVVDIPGTFTYSAQNKTSARQRVMEFTALVGGELMFNKFSISIYDKIGSREKVIFTKGKNVVMLSKTIDKRIRPKKTTYVCKAINTRKNSKVNLGDDILLIQKALNIQETFRIVRITDDLLMPSNQQLEISDYKNGLEDSLFKMETDLNNKIDTETVKQDTLYNGCKISSANGYEAFRSDGKAKVVMNATEGLSMYSGESLERVFYVDTDGRIKAKRLDIEGGSINFGDIEGVPDFAYSSEIPTNVEITQIAADYIATPNLYTNIARVNKLLEIGQQTDATEKRLVFHGGDSNKESYIRSTLNGGYSDLYIKSTSMTFATLEYMNFNGNTMNFNGNINFSGAGSINWGSHSPGGTAKFV